jgi:DNA invertase Pin-like site-specific DNA recombinase
MQAPSEKIELKPVGINKKPGAVIYIRMSTEYQVQADSNSSEMQMSACKRLCERCGIRIKKVIEQVKSGRKFRKDLFDVIQHEMQQGDCIVVYSISRFARRQLHAHQLLDMLKKKRCRLLSATENMDTEKDDTTLGLFAWLAEIESKQISARVKSSIEAKRTRDEHIGAMPYGYRYSNGNGSPLEHNPEEINVVRRMKHMRFVEKLSYMMIARTLNAEQIPSPKKKLICGWTEATVKRIVDRDEDNIPTKGKRSWYANQALAAEEAPESSNDKFKTPNEVPDDESSSDESQNGAAEVTVTPEKVLDQTDSPQEMQSKSLVFLRIKLKTKKEEFGISTEEINQLSKDEIIELLQAAT